MGGKKGARRPIFQERSLAGRRLCGNGETLADYGPPGRSRGNRTLRDCSTGLASVPSELLFGRDRKWDKLGWHSSVLVARTTAASATGSASSGIGSLVKSYRVLALHTSPSPSRGWVLDIP